MSAWMVSDADPPPGALRRLLLTPVRRVTDLRELSAPAKAELWELLAVLVGDESGWCMGCRAGNPQATGGPVGVVEVIVSDPDSPVVVRYPMSARTTLTHG